MRVSIGLHCHPLGLADKACVLELGKGEVEERIVSGLVVLQKAVGLFDRTASPPLQGLGLDGDWGRGLGLGLGLALGLGPKSGGALARSVKILTN